MPDVIVNLAHMSYVIRIEAGALRGIGNMIAPDKPTAILVVSNTVVSRHYGDVVVDSLRAAGLRADLFCVPSGERFKTLRTTKKIYDALLNARIDRKGAIVALGGGVIGDMAGFAAATYLRGIDFYQVPTTLLSQVDASVGGKVAVDLPQGKNLVGAFHQPKAVLIDPATLRTLPARELRSGLAEMVKHGIIYDRNYLESLNKNASALLAGSEPEMAQAISRSVEIKRDVVVQDEREAGLRAILNYGHSVGHAIEMLSGYGRYRHGEAIAVGMVAEAMLAERVGIAEPGLGEVIADSLAAMRLPVQISEHPSTSEIVRAIELDKKTLGGVFRFALPTKIGACSIVEVTKEALVGAINAHKSRSEASGT